MRLSWTRWSLTRMDRRLAKQSRRLELMQTETDLQGLRLALLLREKEQLKMALKTALDKGEKLALSIDSITLNQVQSGEGGATESV